MFYACAIQQNIQLNYKRTTRRLHFSADMRSEDRETFKCTVRAKMAAQFDLLRAKVEENVRGSLDIISKEKKKKKKRDLSPSADKRERTEKDAKRVKLHHHHHHHHNQQHAERRIHQPLQPPPPPQNPQPRNFSSDKHAPHHHQHSHRHHHHHHHNQTNGIEKNLQPTLPPPLPRKVPEQLQRRAASSEPPALFTFTPLKVAKAKTPDHIKEKHREKEPRPKVKKENTEANVKHTDLKKKKGRLFFNCGYLTRVSSFKKW